MDANSPAQQVAATATAPTTASVVCTRCGTVNSGNHKFCVTCGTLLPANVSIGAAAPSPMPPEIAALVNVQVNEIQNRLLDRIAMLDRQVADLQIDQVRERRPWYRDIGLLIAMFAFLFSLGTTVFSYYQARQQDIHNSQVELRGLIQRLNAIPKDEIDIARTYTDSSVAAQLSSSLVDENRLLALQADQIISGIPDSISSSEYIPVALALRNASLFDESGRLVNLAIQRMQNADERVIAYRFQGQLRFASGDIAGGRASFGQALNIFERYPTTSAYYKSTTNALTETDWAQSEALQGQCREASTHQQNAISIAAGLDPSFQFYIAQSKRYIDACVSR